MDVNCLRLRSDWKDDVLRLIQTRIDAKSKICLTDNRINQAWIDEVMSKDSTYDQTHRVFGLFMNRKLDTIFVVKLLDFVYVVEMMVSSKDATRLSRIEAGYGVNTTILLDFALQYMEEEGYDTFYSTIPDHSKWKKAENNPNRPRKNVYDIEVVATVPAGELPKQKFYLNMINRPFNLPMLIRRMTKRPS
jgi:hypothetical protein